MPHILLSTGVTSTGEQNKYDPCPYGVHKQMKKNKTGQLQRKWVLWKGKCAPHKWVYIASEFHLICSGWGVGRGTVS